jgi:hypothetical protein
MQKITAVVRHEFKIKTHDIAEKQNLKENGLNNERNKKHDTKTFHELHLDLLGYTINIATKMISLQIQIRLSSEKQYTIK